MTESERDEAANTLISCIAAVFKQLKSRDPAAYPWVGNMLGTEHIRQLGTSVFIHLNRRGDPPLPILAPADQTRMMSLPELVADPKTPKSRPARPRAPAAPAKGTPIQVHTYELNKGDTFICPECKKAKVWRMDWPGNPKSVCIDCYKAGRAA